MRGVSQIAGAHSYESNRLTPAMTRMGKVCETVRGTGRPLEVGTPSCSLRWASMDIAIVSTAEHYREEAARARQMADMRRHAEYREMLLDVADQYELLARVTEQDQPLLSP